MNFSLKNLLFLLLGLFICELNVSAQAPQGIPYQAIARNASGVAIANTAVKVRFSIRDSIATGAIKYQETHNPTTSALGLFSVNVGMGTIVTGTFSGINWGKNAKFLQVEMDPAGGVNYIELGTTQMMSVPYALYAGISQNTSATPTSFYEMISDVTPGGTYIQAVNYCFNLIENGYNDWRLASLEEWNNYGRLKGYQTSIGWTTTNAGAQYGGFGNQVPCWWIITDSGPEVGNPTSQRAFRCVR
jgi:hypothetical protein